jgi:hypothetical protein
MQVLRRHDERGDQRRDERGHDDPALHVHA